MADYTKTGEREVLAHQALTLGTSATGTLSVAPYLAGELKIFHANIGTTANASGAVYRVMTSGNATDDDKWSLIAEFRTDSNASAQGNLDGTEAVGQTLIELDTGEGSSFAVEELVYIQDTGTIADSEWNYLVDQAADDVTLGWGITREKDSLDDIFNEAEIFTLSLDLSGVIRVRVLVNHNVSATGSTIHTVSTMTTTDAIE